MKIHHFSLQPSTPMSRVYTWWWWCVQLNKIVCLCLSVFLFYIFFEHFYILFSVVGGTYCVCMCRQRRKLSSVCVNKLPYRWILFIKYFSSPFFSTTKKECFQLEIWIFYAIRIKYSKFYNKMWLCGCDIYSVSLSYITCCFCFFCMF